MELGMLQLRSYIVILVNLASFLQTSKRLSRGSSKGVSFNSFKPEEFSYLNITNIGSNLVEVGSECGFACLEIHSCFSYNLAAPTNRDVNGKLLCELLPSDKYNNSDRFIASLLFQHFSIPSPCSSWPCQNNGTCVPQYEQKSYGCLCPKEYKGVLCQTVVDKCTSNPSQNGGECNTLIDAYNCTCPSGLTGVHCEKDILNECENNPCVNNGTCTDLVNGFSCRCPPEFYGDRCETGFSINSSIISNNTFYRTHLAQFLAPAVGDISQWLLCHRASTHGWAASTFHNRCDGKYNTVTIVKNDQYAFGGYTDIPWVSNTNDYGSTSKAFIFSLRDKEDLGPFKSIVAVPSYAIRRRYALYGPTFGRGYDFYIADHANSNTDSFTEFDDPDNSNVYPAPVGTKDRQTILAGTFHFSPDDWEVFYLV